jgi:hypothetical protein
MNSQLIKNNRSFVHSRYDYKMMRFYTFFIRVMLSLKSKTLFSVCLFSFFTIKDFKRSKLNNYLISLISRNMNKDYNGITYHTVPVYL